MVNRSKFHGNSGPGFWKLKFACERLRCFFHGRGWDGNRPFIEWCCQEEGSVYVRHLIIDLKKPGLGICWGRPSWAEKVYKGGCIMHLALILEKLTTFPWNKGISLPQLPFGVKSCEVAIIWLYGCIGFQQSPGDKHIADRRYGKAPYTYKYDISPVCLTTVGIRYLRDNSTCNS